MAEDCNDIPIGITLSMSMYAVCIYILDKLLQILIQIYKIDNRIVFIAYFVPLVILYIEVPNLLRKSDKWQKYVE